MDTVYKNAYLDAAFGDDHTADFPATVYLALFKTGDVEVTGGAYARKSVANTTANFPDAAGGEKENGVAIAFVAASANWGTVTAFKWMDAAAAGNIIHAGNVATPTAINTGMTANFPAGSLVVTAAAA